MSVNTHPRQTLHITNIKQNPYLEIASLDQQRSSLPQKNVASMLGCAGCLHLSPLAPPRAFALKKCYSGRAFRASRSEIENTSAPMVDSFCPAKQERCQVRERYQRRAGATLDLHFPIPSQTSRPLTSASRLQVKHRTIPDNDRTLQQCVQTVRVILQ